MAFKLKDLKITKVDFVEAGANPEANILFFKSKDGTPGAKSSEPIAAKGGEKSENPVKKFFSAIAKALGIAEDEHVGEAIEEIAKGYEAATFGEKMDEQKRRRVTSEIWDVCYALEESLCSIICDDDVPEDEKPAMMEQSLNEFAEAVKELIPTWAQGKTTNKIAKNDQPITPARLELAKAAKEKLEAIIAKAEKDPETDPEDTSVQDGCKKPKQKKSKGDVEDMKIDKSKLTPEELAMLEAIEKKAGIPDEPANDPNPAAPATEVNKSAGQAGDNQNTGEEEDIYKGLHPAVKAELERLRKAADQAEEKELTEIAKKYEIIGKKPEELVPLFKSLKKAGGNAYEQMIAILDASVEAVEKSGIFSEIGKKGNDGTIDAWAAIEKHADEIMKSMPNLTRAQAIDKACQLHPELVHEYEKNR
jgi:hypothetical protein